MKIAQLLLLVIVGGAGGWFAHRQKPQEGIPTQALPVGFNFVIPTSDGNHTLTVKSTTLTREYHLEDEVGRSADIPEEVVLSWLETLSVPVPVAK